MQPQISIPAGLPGGGSGVVYPLRVISWGIIAINTPPACRPSTAPTARTSLPDTGSRRTVGTAGNWCGPAGHMYSRQSSAGIRRAQLFVAAIGVCRRSLPQGALPATGCCLQVSLSPTRFRAIPPILSATPAAWPSGTPVDVPVYSDGHTVYNNIPAVRMMRVPPVAPAGTMAQSGCPFPPDPAPVLSPLDELRREGRGAVIRQAYGGTGVFGEPPGRPGRGRQPVRQLDYQHLPVVGHAHYHRVPHHIRAAGEDAGYGCPDLPPLCLYGVGLRGAVRSVHHPDGPARISNVLVNCPAGEGAGVVGDMMPAFLWRRRAYSARAAWPSAFRLSRNGRSGVPPPGAQIRWIDHLGWLARTMFFSAPSPEAPAGRGRVPYGGRVDGQHGASLLAPSGDGPPRLFNERSLLLGGGGAAAWYGPYGLHAENPSRPAILRAVLQMHGMTPNLPTMRLAAIPAFRVPRTKPLADGG